MVSIVVYLLYSYGDKLVPKTILGSIPPPETARIIIPAPASQKLFERPDFLVLKPFGDVPIKPLRSGGSPEPFLDEPK